MSLPRFDSNLRFSSSFVDELPCDATEGHHVQPKAVYSACYSSAEPTPTRAPQLLALNQELALSLSISADLSASKSFCDVVSGNGLFVGMQPFAMCYGGHQFGHWAGQLGDGRAINLAGIPWQGKGRDSCVAQLQLKGAGPTPYSRSADGRAVLRSSIREYVCSEAMYYLNVPTTRALSLALTGDPVERDMFYDGNAEFEPGAVVCRVSESFIRFGSFEIFSSRGDLSTLEALVGYTIRHHYPHLTSLFDVDKAEATLAMFGEVVERSCRLVVEWMRVGFVHGVLNTDNMSIIGESIDYGPYGWLDAFSPDWTPNTTDKTHGRYRYKNQPSVVQWNLLQLANALYPLIQDAAPLEEIVRGFTAHYDGAWSKMMSNKLGLVCSSSGDDELKRELENLLEKIDVDMTHFYRQLTDWDMDTESVEDIRPCFVRCIYSDHVSEQHLNALNDWLTLYQDRRGQKGESNVAARELMSRANPVLTPRNFLVQEVIDGAHKGDVALLHRFMAAIKTPYELNQKTREFVRMRPEWALTKAGCSMLSCSS